MSARTCLSLAILLLAVPQVVLAQYGRTQRSNAPPPKEINIDGLVEGVQGDVIQMKDSTGTHLIKLQPNFTKFGVTGMAKTDYLKPGLLVSFTADIPPGKEKTVELEEPLTDLQIIAPSDTNKPGMFNEDRDNKESTKFFVRAPVRTYKEGKLTVVASGKTIIATLPADAEIKVESTELGIVRMGDSISVKGQGYPPVRGQGDRVEPGQVLGQTVDIKLQEALTASTFKKKK